MSVQNQVIALFLAADVFYRFKNPSTGVFSNPVKIETEKLEITTPSELTEKTSRGRDTYGQTFVSHRVPQPTEFSVTFSEQTRHIFAMSLAGELEEISTSIQTITEEAVTVVLDEWVPIGYRNINPTGFSVKNSAGTTTYVLGTDYEINPRLGLLKAKSSGAIAAGVVEVSGATLAKNGFRVIGGRQYSHVLSFQVDGRNQITNQDVFFEGFQATVSPEDARDFLSGELDSLPVTGRLEIPPDGDRPFNLEVYN